MRLDRSHSFQVNYEWSALEAYRLIFLICMGTGVVNFLITLLLSPDCEVKSKQIVVPETGPLVETTPLLESVTEEVDKPN